MVTSENKGEIAQAVREAMEANKNPRDLMYTKGMEYLWSREKLKMISRLNDEKIYQIARSYIIMSFYQKWYTERRCEITILKNPKPPYYTIKKVETCPEYMSQYDNKFEEFIKDVMELFISGGDGKGRDELLNLMKNADVELSLKEKAINAIQQFK